METPNLPCSCTSSNSSCWQSISRLVVPKLKSMERLPAKDTKQIQRLAGYMATSRGPSQITFTTRKYNAKMYKGERATLYTAQIQGHSIKQ
eukprot:1159464-Pelagomonas_calceolata.AAC.11